MTRMAATGAVLSPLQTDMVLLACLL